MQEMLLLQSSRIKRKVRFIYSILYGISMNKEEMVEVCPDCGQDGCVCGEIQD